MLVWLAAACSFQVAAGPLEPECTSEATCRAAANGAREDYRRCRDDTAGDCLDEHRRYVRYQGNADRYLAADQQAQQEERQRAYREKKRQDEETERARQEQQEREAAARAAEQAAEAEKEAQDRQAAIDALPLDHYLLKLKDCHVARRPDCETIVGVAAESTTLSTEDKQKVARNHDDWERLNAAPKTRMLLCRDGTTSASCECGGPRRGCCSSHGGVAGCEPP